MAVINPHTTRATGTVLTASIYNTDHQNHITNCNNLNAQLATVVGVGSATGMIASNGAGVISGRTLQGTANQISISNPSGVAGDPTIAIATNPTIPGNVTIGGTLTATAGAVTFNVANTNTVNSTTVNATTVNSTTGGFLSMSGAGRPPTTTLITATGNWVRPAGCKTVIVKGVGPGGGSGGISAAAGGEAGSGGGAGGGMYGESHALDVTGTATIACVIGAPGTAGTSAGTDGGNGGTTQFTHNATVYAFSGGQGSKGYTPNLAVSSGSDGGVAASLTSNLPIKGSNAGTNGRSSASAANADGGNGGASPYGRSGDGAHRISAGATIGTAGTGYGAGAGGGAIVGPSGGINGQVGAPSMLLFTEYY